MAIPELEFEISQDGEIMSVERSNGGSKRDANMPHCLILSDLPSPSHLCSAFIPGKKHIDSVYNHLAGAVYNLGSHISASNTALSDDHRLKISECLMQVWMVI